MHVSLSASLCNHMFQSRSCAPNPRLHDTLLFSGLDYYLTLQVGGEAMKGQTMKEVGGLYGGMESETFPRDPTSGP